MAGGVDAGAVVTAGLFRLWLVLRAVLKGLSRVALLGILAFTVVDVGGRYLFNLPLEGTTTLITDLFFPAVVFLSLGYVAEVDGHVRVELLWGRLQGRGRRILEIAFALAIALFWLVIAWLAGERAWQTYLLDLRPISSVGVPLFVSYAVVSLGSVTAAAAGIIGLSARGRRLALPEAGPQGMQGSPS